MNDLLLVSLKLEIESLGGGLNVQVTGTFPQEIRLYDHLAGMWIDEGPWTIIMHPRPYRD